MNAPPVKIKVTEFEKNVLEDLRERRDLLQNRMELLQEVREA